MLAREVAFVLLQPDPAADWRRWCVWPRMPLTRVASLDPGEGLYRPGHAGPLRILRSLLEGRIAFTPRSAGDETWYEFAGQASLARVLTEVASTKGLVAPTGCEPVFTVRHALS